MRYAQGYMASLRTSYPAAPGPTCTYVLSGPRSSSGSAAEVSNASEQQCQFFKDVDGYRGDVSEDTSPQPMQYHACAFTSQAKKWELALSAATRALPTVVPSASIVMGAAVFLIGRKLFEIPDVGTLNVKQARAFLHVAAWLQQRMITYWIDSGQLPAATTTASPATSISSPLVLVGPGGTGKTTVLRVAEALIDHFAGAESVRKCAISNTASRLLGGDTMHALCKLPREDMQQRAGRLTSSTLKKHRERWRSASAVFIDEISMVGPEQLHQADIRIQQATQNMHQVFGGLGAVLSGDFLQLPPVDRGSLAKAFTAVTQEPMGEAAGSVVRPPDNKTVHNTAHQADVDPGERDDVAETGESSQGMLLWHSLNRVVSLHVNVRAPGVLGRLLAEMREGNISDEMWRVFLPRILQRSTVSKSYGF